MSDTEYTPTTNSVRNAFCVECARGAERKHAAEFDRWLAAHDAELTERVRAEQREASRSAIAQGSNSDRLRTAERRSSGMVDDGARRDSAPVLGINNLAAACYANSKAHGFTRYGDMLRDGAFPADTELMYEGNLLMLVVGELSEAHEQLRHGRAMTERWYSEGEKPEGVPSELADVIIRVLDICGAYGIDIEDAIAEKMKYNEGRPFLHNKKF